MGSGEADQVAGELNLKVQTSKKCTDEDEKETEIEEEAPPSPASRVFLDPKFNCYIIAIIGVARSIDADVVRRGVGATLARHPRFSSGQIIESGKSKWVRVNVDLVHHVIVPDLGPQSSPNNNDQLVEDYVTSLTSGPGLDPSRPLWDVHLLNVPTSSAAATAVLRVHHSIGDGISLTYLLRACTRKLPAHSASSSVPPETRRPQLPKARATLCALLTLIWSALLFYFNTFVDLLLFFATVWFLKDTKTPIMGSNGVEFRPKTFVHRAVSIDDIKAVKSSMHCTINDVLLGITSAGLSRYLRRRYGAGKNEVLGLNNGSLRATMLVNIRPTSEVLEAAIMKKNNKGRAMWGNKLGLMLVPLPIATHEDPLDYVRKAKAIADRKKNSLQPFIVYIGVYLTEKLFGIEMVAAVTRRILRHTTLSFSNCAGLAEEIEFYGHPLVYIAPSVYGHPQAITFHFYSFASKIIMVLAADKLVIPDPHQLIEDLAESFKLIREAATNSRPS